MTKYNFILNLNERNSLSVILQRIKNNTTVLEFGTANGRMSKYLTETLHCKVYGIEIDKNSAQDAKKFCTKIIIDDIESYTWLTEYQDIKFDYIIFADVLEHLYEPDKVLSTSKSLLKETGSIFLSIPNIAHNAIIMELLNDKFIYKSTGLLDNTHIRFFTKNTIDELIKKSDLEIEYETGIYFSPEKTEFGYYYNDIDNGFSSILANREYGEVYQFILEVKKKSVNPQIDFKKIEHSTLFFDTGKGFNDHQIATTTFDYKNDSKIVFNLEKKVNGVKSIRIDPLENTLILKIQKIFINHIEIDTTIQHNGIYDPQTHEIIFSHNDPYIIVDFAFPQEISHVSIVYNYFSKSFNQNNRKIQQQNHTIQLLQQTINTKKIKIKTLKQHILIRKKLIQNFTQQLKYKDQKIIEYERLKEEYTDIYLSTSWKMTRFLRKLKRFFR